MCLMLCVLTCAIVSTSLFPHGGDGACHAAGLELRQPSGRREHRQRLHFTSEFPAA